MIEQAEQKVSPNEKQSLQLPDNFGPKQFVNQLTESVTDAGFTIYQVEFAISKTEEAGLQYTLTEPFVLEKKQNFDSGCEGVFILNHQELGRYLVQFESGYLHPGNMLFYQAEVRRIDNTLPLLSLNQTIKENQAVLHYRHQESSIPDTSYLQQPPMIELSGADEFLKKFISKLQKSALPNCDVLDEGEIPTPKALGDLLIRAIKEQKTDEKLTGRPHVIYLSQEAAQEIQRAGIDVNSATQAVTNITGIPVAIKK